MRKFLRSTLLRAPKMAVEVVPEASEKITPRRQDLTTQRRRARYPPPTPPQAQVACPVSKEAGRQETSRDIWWRGRCEPAASSQRQQPTRRRPATGDSEAPALHLEPRAGFAGRGPVRRRLGTRRFPPAPHHLAGLAREMMIPREPLRPEPPSDS